MGPVFHDRGCQSRRFGILREERVLRVMIVRSERAATFVEWSER